jgi:ABC-2 type transport system ATP-binding protein
LIEVSGFHKSYREIVAVSGLSFRVQSGEILGLVGPNGAGKTTTLRALSGIIHPTKGEVCLGGHDVVKAPMRAKQNLAYIPDDPKLFDALTIWEHLQFAASAHGISDYTERAESLMEAFQLTEKRDALASELSRGMRQKVAVCCGYLHEPSAILYDEPIAGLDPRGIRTLKASMAERAESGAALIVSSHMLSLVEDLCTHLLILHRGQRLFFGTVDEARDAYSELGDDDSLEEIFFRATEGPDIKTGTDEA